jgi:GGDEF domain-containing protein
LSSVAQETAESILTEQVSHSVSMKEEEALMSEVVGLSQAITNLAQTPKKQPSPPPAPVAVGVTESSPHRHDGTEHAPAARGQVRAHAESPQSLGPRTAPVDTAADPTLLLKLETAVASCRISRCALSFVLVELDRVDDLIVTRGVQGFQQVMKILKGACWAAGVPSMDCVPHGEAGYALILPDCERRKAVEMGAELIHVINRVPSVGLDRGPRAASLSVGVASVAMPPKNFPPNDLFTSANRCLYGSHSSGGGVVKSLEIF